MQIALHTVPFLFKMYSSTIVLLFCLGVSVRQQHPSDKLDQVQMSADYFPSQCLQRYGRLTRTAKYVRQQG